MNLDPWYKIVTPRKEVREGRSFNPDEFAIALEQVVAGTAPEDYRDPDKFFGRTCFTRALRDHSSLVLRRLAGETVNTAPVITLITQFGGGKTHTLTALYHLANNGSNASAFPGVADLLGNARLPAVPRAKVAVFVGNAWDPQAGRGTPWIDLARQLAGDAGVALLGQAAQSTPPGTEAIGRMIEAAGGSVLILFDEVLNFINRHRNLADGFYAFIQNLTVAVTGLSRSAVVVSLPRSQTEMTDWDLQWQDKITKVVRRVAKDLIANDEAEISEVVRRRLFEDLGDERLRKRAAKAFADWCFERRAQLPPEYTAVDTTATESKAREFLQSRFEACYPFHPATLSVFQRKWQALPQYQQTRGTLAMLAQWIAWAYKESFTQARREPLITLGSAPLDVPDFRSVVLGQLGEAKLMTAIETDIAGAQSHARSLDADTKGVLRDIHRRVGATILFESSGGQADKVAHLPELRFALGEPELDTTSIDTAALTLESRAYFIRKFGTDGFRIHHKPTLKKVVNDRRASLDEDTEVRPTMKTLVKAEFDYGRSLPIAYFPADGATIPDSPKLTLVVLDPKLEWGNGAGLREQLLEWTRRRGTSDRLYPGALVWCIKKPGRELLERTEAWLAWKRVKKEVDDGTLGSDFEPSELSDIRTELKGAEEEAKNEVWASYRFVVITDSQEADGLRTIDLGAGHASAGETLCGRVIAALKSNALLNESPGAGYLDRRWPPAFKDTGAWPLISLRQAFLTGALDRLLDPDAYLRSKIPEFVERGEFGLASGQKPDGTYERLWFKELLPSDEISFEADVYLLKKATAQALKTEPKPKTGPLPRVEPQPPITPTPQPTLTGSSQPVEPQARQLHLFGDVPPEAWNRLGTKLIPKLRSGQDLKVNVSFTLQVNASASKNLVAELKQILDDLGIADKVSIDEK
ncbi:hypothetical protein ANRL4_05364 [Anaerolineae bacterium]|nr:hypothetical protein ANRL4_05364 [Anaerolineae bacterium]